MDDETKELRELVLALARLETSVSSSDRELRSMIKQQEDSIHALRKEISDRAYVTEGIYQNDLKHQRERDKRVHERLDGQDDKYTWITRALIGAFIGILVQAAVIALSMGGS